MIASGYTLDLYCDREGCEEHAHYSAQYKGPCVRAARRRGWKLRERLTIAICPTCAKSKARKVAT